MAINVSGNSKWQLSLGALIANEESVVFSSFIKKMIYYKLLFIFLCDYKKFARQFSVPFDNVILIRDTFVKFTLYQFQDSTTDPTHYIYRFNSNFPLTFADSTANAAYICLFNGKFNLYLPIKQQISFHICRLNGESVIYLPIQRQIQPTFTDSAAHFHLHLPIQRQIRVPFADSMANSSSIC